MICRPKTAGSQPRRNSGHCYFVDVAKQDFRDVLFWSDCPDEAKIDTPEKKRSLREMLAKLGLKPPSDLDDA